MKSTSILQLSGESGGGQLLRSALVLSMVTGRPFRMTNIRGKRPKPGLMRQHLTCVKAEVALERHGFMQAGGGIITATIHPVKKWKKLKLTERGGRLGSIARVLHAHLHRDIAQRQISTAAKVLGWNADDFELRYANDSTGPGNALLLGAQFENITEICSGIAQFGKSSSPSPKS